MKRILLCSTLVLLLFSSAAYSKEAVRFETGLYYRIKEGDTLWSIAEKIGGSAALWPDIWRANSSIPDPHLIFPGERIAISKKSRIIYISSNQDEKDQIPDELGPDETTLKPAFYLFPSINSTGSLLQYPMMPFAKIVSAQEKSKEMLGTGDICYIEETVMPLRPGSLMTIYRTTDLSSNGVKIGEQQIVTGIAKITKRGSTLLESLIIKSFRDIRVGDNLIPYIEKSPEVPIKKAPPGITGKLVASEEGNLFIGDQTTAFIDKGSDHGIETGQIFFLFHEEPAGPGKEAETRTDDAVILVLHTTPTTATVLVTAAKRPVSPGAGFRSP